MDYKIIYHEQGKDSLFKMRHISKQLMFIYMHSDGGSIVCGEKTYFLKKGTLCFVGTGKYHYIMSDNPSNYDRSMLFVSADYFDKILEILSTNIMPYKLSSKAFVYAIIDEDERNKVEEIFKKIKEYEHDEIYGKWIVISCVIELLVFLNRYLCEIVSSTTEVVSRAIEYIIKNACREITIDEICFEMHMSKYHFCRQFRKTTGTTVMKYILKTRLIMAKNMILNENLSITEISNRCGFSSISYFSRVFKEENGISPLNYKKEMQV
ncbi:MAG: helix-turn-helix transcriptional regulator [Clostridia bacterium]|nr:helix-turn-helix transcriptional regulator [Clostridia bacterium]